MSDSTVKKFTLGDLAKIALGANELTEDHLSVLQSLLIILLHKLNCHNESVRIQGFPAKCLQTLIANNPDKSPYNFNTKNIKSFQENFDVLSELERKTEEIDIKIAQHFKQIHDCHKSNTFAASKWDFYASPTEDLCTLWMKHNQKFCALAHSAVFNIEMHSRVVPLMIARIKKFETQTENMQNKLLEILQLRKKANSKMKCVQFVIRDIGDIRLGLDSWSRNFREAVMEVQEMLNCKLHRVTLPALKRFLEPCFQQIKERLRMLKQERVNCPNQNPLDIKNKKSCLSCSRHQEFASLPEFQNLKSNFAESKCVCGGRLSIKEPTILLKLDKISSIAPTVRTSSWKKVELNLQSHGILTKYDSSKITQTTNQTGVNFTIMKPNLKKQSVELEMEKSIFKKFESIKTESISSQESLGTNF